MAVRPCPVSFAKDECRLGLLGTLIWRLFHWCTNEEPTEWKMEDGRWNRSSPEKCVADRWLCCFKRMLRMIHAIILQSSRTKWAGHPVIHRIKRSTHFWWHLHAFTRKVISVKVQKGVGYQSPCKGRSTWLLCQGGFWTRRMAIRRGANQREVSWMKGASSKTQDPIRKRYINDESLQKQTCQPKWLKHKDLGIPCQQVSSNITPLKIGSLVSWWMMGDSEWFQVLRRASFGREGSDMASASHRDVTERSNFWI